MMYSDDDIIDDCSELSQKDLLLQLIVRWDCLNRRRQIADKRAGELVADTIANLRSLSIPADLSGVQEVIDSLIEKLEVL